MDLTPKGEPPLVLGENTGGNGFTILEKVDGDKNSKAGRESHFKETLGLKII